MATKPTARPTRTASPMAPTKSGMKGDKYVTQERFTPKMPTLK